MLSCHWPRTRCLESGTASVGAVGIATPKQIHVEFITALEKDISIGFGLLFSDDGFDRI